MIEMYIKLVMEGKRSIEPNDIVPQVPAKYLADVKAVLGVA